MPVTACANGEAGAVAGKRGRKLKERSKKRAQEKRCDTVETRGVQFEKARE